MHGHPRQDISDWAWRTLPERTLAGANASIKRQFMHGHPRQTIPDWTWRRQPVTSGFAQVWLDGSLPGWMHLSATVTGRRHHKKNYLNTVFFTLNWQTVFQQTDFKYHTCAKPYRYRQGFGDSPLKYSANAIGFALARLFTYWQSVKNKKSFDAWLHKKISIFVLRISQKTIQW